MSDYSKRVEKLQAAMQAQGAAVAVFGPSDQMRYLTGWAEQGHERLVGLFVPAQGDPAFLVPVMNRQQAQSNPAQIARVLGWDDATGWLPQAQSLLAEWGLADQLALIDDELPSGHLLDLQALLPKVRCKAAGETMTRLRERKTEEELAAMGAAAALIDAIYEEALEAVKEGMTESDLQEFVLAALKRHNTSPSFTPTVCFGENGAMPHYSPGGRKLERGDIVVLDMGCLSDGYCSDITRTFAFGEPRDPDAAKIYDLVSRAHWAARESAKPGVTGEAVDAAARKLISDAGYGPEFFHRTGHGIGLSVHEPPNIVAGNTAPLQPGMCFSIEPGIYLPGRFGVRIENIVTVTSDGARSFNAEAPRQLPILSA